MGGPQSGTVKIFFQRSSRKNLNCEQSMNDKQIIFCVLQISGNLQSNHDQFHLAEYTCLPITAPSIKPWFWQFFAFSRKTRDIFLRYFLIYHRTIVGQFFPVLTRGVTFNVPLENPQKRLKNANFRIIHQIKKWEYEPLRKNEWLRRFWQNFWVSTNFATFFGQKIITQKIVIWVLKRSALTRQI